MNVTINLMQINELMNLFSTVLNNTEIIRKKHGTIVF